MLKHTRSVVKAAVLAIAMLPLPSLAEIVTLSGTLGAANQNGSDPAQVTDPLGVVPTDAFGAIEVTLDTEANTLDFSMDVTGIFIDELRGFGPNSTPIHLHLAGGGNPGNFGPIAIDLSLNAADADFVATDTGFQFSRKHVSILLEDQGNIQLGMHPGNDRIVDALQGGSMFVLTHSLKDIFINDTGPVPGFPFGEIRGNITRDPVLAKSNPAVGMDIIILKDETDVQTAVDHLTASLEHKGFTIPLVINHAGAATSVGLDMAPNQVIFARAPSRLESKLLSKGTTIGIDMPLKFQVFEQGGMIKLSVNTLGYLIDRHELSINDFVLKITDKLIEQFGTSGPAGYGLKTIASLQSYDETVQAIQDAILENTGAGIPLVLDYATGGGGSKGHHPHGQSKPLAATLIAFGDPRVGTPLMQADPRMGIDLPLRYLVWKDRHGEVNITYEDMAFIAGRVNLQGFDGRVSAINNVLDKIATIAAGQQQVILVQP